MRVEAFIAFRLLRDARAQSLLIACGAAVGVAVIVFLTALISGLQDDLISRTVGAQAHVSIRPPLQSPRPLWRATSDQATAVISRIEKDDRRLRALDGARDVLSRVRGTHGVHSAAAVCSGPGSALRGAAEASVSLTGVEPAAYERVVSIAGRIVGGRFELPARGAIIGDGLADALGLAVGDRMRLRTTGRAGAVFTVRGIAHYGVQRQDDTSVLLPMRDAQALLGLPGEVTGIEVSVDDIYGAEEVADRLRRATGLDAVSWMERNAQLLAGLRSQSSSSALIQAFVLLSVAIGIASVLVVSVVQRRREIGILRAMGLRRRLVQRVFLIEGALLGLSGAVLGAGLGIGLVLAFRTFAVRADGVRLFAIEVTPALLLGAGAVSVATGLLSALFPARRAAGLDPAVAIRNE